MATQSPSSVPQQPAQLPKRPNPTQRTQDHKRPKLAHRGRRPSPDAFRVAIICALAAEATAVRAFFNYCWEEDDTSYGCAATDQNSYTFGAVGCHDVVLVHMPGMGKSQAAKAAADCLTSFPNIQIALLVGICGGVPSGNGKQDIMLGDVVVSEYVVQLDFGRRLPDRLETKKTGLDALERPNAKIRAHINKMKSDLSVEITMADLISQTQHLASYPGSANDVLFDPEYRHKHHDQTCNACARCFQRTDPACDESIHSSCETLGCDRSRLIPRRRPSDDDDACHIPAVHYGVYASTDMVMRSGEDRDEIARKEGIIAFEMEAAGVWQSFPGQAIVIKGVCDYADSHKNKSWQMYAAFAAAAYMKVFLAHWVPPPRPAQTKLEVNILQEEGNRKCLSDLRLTDPRDDKDRIEKTKGGLYLGASRWILDHLDFRQIRESENTRFLWIRGDPGKGKTMLIITIINELEEHVGGPDDPYFLSYFLCQGTNKDLNYATSVLRGLLYRLILQHPPLISHLRAAYDHSGSKLFEDGNSFFALCQILEHMFEDPQLSRVYLIVDALDECTEQQEQLLKFVSESTTRFPEVRWIVSSRNVQLIEHFLQVDTSGIKLVLETSENAWHVTQAVNAYIDFEMQKLLTMSESDNRSNKVKTILREKARGTFLWVALAIQELLKTPRHRVLRALDNIPSGLTNLYDLMLTHAQQQHEEDWELCRLVLAAVTLAYRPLHVGELGVLSGMPEDIRGNMADLNSVLELCRPFITVQQDDTVCVIHQSAQDYLKHTAMAEIFPKGHAYVHRCIYTQSLEIMKKILVRNICGLAHPGSPLETQGPGEYPDGDPLLPVRYSVAHWTDHLGEAPDEDILSDTGAVYTFLTLKLLNWIEALCLTRALPGAIMAISKLVELVKAGTQRGQLQDLLLDILRFVRYFKAGIENHPLQIYTAGLVFCPKRSIVKGLYAHEELKWVREPLLAIPAQWGPCEQVFESYSNGLTSVAYSPDGKKIACSSHDGNIEIWHASTGVCEKILEGHQRHVSSVAFSQDGKHIGSASWDKTVRLWNADSGACEHTLHGYEEVIWSIYFSSDGKLLASDISGGSIQIWHTDSQVCKQTLKGHGRKILAMAFSSDCQRIAYGFFDGTIQIWCAERGNWESEQILKSYSHNRVTSISFSPNGKQIASGSILGYVQIWRAEKGLWTFEQILKGHVFDVADVAFSPDGHRIASASGDNTIRIWHAGTGGWTLTQILKGHSHSVGSVVFSPGGTQIASASRDNTIRIWRTKGDSYEQNPADRVTRVNSVAFSPDGMWLALAGLDGTVRIWRVETGACEQTFKAHTGSVTCVAFSPDGLLLASAGIDLTARIWHIETAVCKRIIETDSSRVKAISFSPNGLWLGLAADGFVRIWQVETGVCEEITRDSFESIQHIAFSPDGLWLAASSNKQTIRIWRVETGFCDKIIDSQPDGICSMAFSTDGTQLRAPSGTTIALSDTPSSVCFPGCGLGKDRRWITWNGVPILWLPMDYQPTHIGISRSSMAISPGSGPLLILNFDPLSLDKLVDRFSP